ncbi:MAG TPA: TonB C-terminal domain-containing protein [Steroidobacteraceae bacterium]|nr:TonB C-terminal domain-containing protein [Steroidobacteraceae bacterium]
MRDARRRRREAATRIAGGLAALLMIGGFAEFVHKMMSLKASKPSRQIETIQLIRPPPPPPPPDQPPPPPEKVEQPLPQDKPQPTPDEPQQQAPDLLANAGPGAAGSDAFGMHQGAGGFIGGTGTAPYAWYTNRMRDEIKNTLAKSSCVKSARGSVTTRVLLGAGGQVKHIELTTSTGSERVDECLDKALASITQVGADPPPGMPAIVNLKLVF